MILSGREIIAEQGRGLEIQPFSLSQVNPNSYNLKLHNELLVYDEDLLDMKKSNSFHFVQIPNEGLVLKPGKLYLGRTVEYTKTSKFIPMLEGRSSIGRLGLCIHITAGFGDIGFNGYWTLELFCVQPIKIYPFIDICQIYYHTICGEYDLYASNKYNNNKSIQPSLLFRDFNVGE